MFFYNPVYRTITCILLAVFMFPAQVFTQTSRDPGLVDNGTTIEGKTRALIIGISKYEYIDSLQYADRDAQVFADYLRNNDFWHIDKDDITLLVNDKAKNGDLITQLARIARASKPGDNLLFYFSGHGDVETLTQFNNGYLLAYDTYNNNYIAGALPISFLKELFVTLLNKNVKILLVTDACRSGKLAGGIKGAEFAASAISDMWKNEIKILSSQPGQLSFEGTKWGNGRGVFSYYLVKGLSGEADVNKDSAITLSELEVYVGNNVARETGNKQQPIFEGPNKYSTILARLLPPSNLASPKPGGNYFTPSFKHFKIPADTCYHYYKEMIAAIKERRFRKDDPLSATPSYQKLKSCSIDTPLVTEANSQLLAALMNNIQEIVNYSFIGQKMVSDEDLTKGMDMIDQVVRNNDLQLPYDEHLKNLNRYFLVMLNTSNDSTKSIYSVDQLNLMIDSALNEEPDAAYLLTAKSRLEMKQQNWENAIALQEKSLEKSPGWLTPKYYLGMSYANKKNYDKAMDFFEEIMKKDSSNKTFDCTKCAFKEMAEWARKLKMDKKSQEYFLKSIKYIPETPEIPDPFEDSDFFDHPGNDSAKQFMKRMGKHGDSSFSRQLRSQIAKQLEGLPIPGFVMDSIRNYMDDFTDSSQYFYLKGIQSKKEKGNADSITHYFTRAVELEPDEVFYLESLIDQLQEQGKEAEIQNVLAKNMKKYDEDDQIDLKFMLAKSYLRNKKLRESFSIYKDLITAGEYSCDELKAMKAQFDKLPEYTDYIKNCKDKDRDEDMKVRPPKTPKH